MESMDSVFVFSPLDLKQGVMHSIPIMQLGRRDGKNVANPALCAENIAHGFQIRERKHHFSNMCSFRLR